MIVTLVGIMKRISSYTENLGSRSELASRYLSRLSYQEELASHCLRTGIEHPKRRGGEDGGVGSLVSLHMRKWHQEETTQSDMLWQGPSSIIP